MITRDEALRIAHERINAWQGAIAGDSLIILDAQTIEKDWGWVFFYTSRLWHETGDIGYAIAGNAPFIVERDSGRVLALGTAGSLKHYLDRYERYGDPHFEPGPEICLATCSGPIDRIAAIKLLRDHSGVGFQSAGQIVEDCITGRRPCVRAHDVATADQLARDLESIGFVVSRLPMNNELSGPD